MKTFLCDHHFIKTASTTTNAAGTATTNTTVAFY